MRKKYEASSLAYRIGQVPEKARARLKSWDTWHFRAYFRDRFARCPDLLVQEFRSYLADFLRLREADLETAGFQQEFRKWISMMYHNLQAVVHVNEKRLEVFAIERSVRQGCPLSPLLYVFVLEPLLRVLRDEKVSPTLSGIPFASHLTAKVFAFADDTTVFVFRRLEIKAGKKAVARNEQIARAKINFDESEDLWVGAWRGGVSLLGPFHWSDEPIRILGVCFDNWLQLERNWSEVQAKVDAQVGTFEGSCS